MFTSGKLSRAIFTAAGSEIQNECMKSKLFKYVDNYLFLYSANVLCILEFTRLSPRIFYFLPFTDKTSNVCVLKEDKC